MSRTHLIPGTSTAMFNSPEHEHQTVMGNALEGLIASRFRFDPIATVKSITTDIVRDEVMNSLTWYTDILIQTAVGAMLSDFYRVVKRGAERDEGLEQLPTFDTYDEFTKYVESLGAQEETLYAFGIDTKPRIDSIHKLLAFRNELHNVIAGDPDLTRCRAGKLIEGVYRTPDADIIFNTPPKLRGISARDEKGFLDIAKDEISRAGLTDVAEIEAFTEQLLLEQREQQAVDNLNALNWDRRKANALQTLWVCVGMADRVEGDDEQTFEELDAAVQLKIIARLEGALTTARTRAVKSNKLKLMEKAAMRLEVLTALKAIDHAVAHPRFSELLDA